MSARDYDINGWFEVKSNPLSKVGVFEYSGAMIDASGEFGLDPDKTYNVLRSEEELSDPECIDSFKLIPWIDNHTMLGGDFTPVERKGMQGVVGEDVYFDDSDLTLKGNVKVFTDSLEKTIDQGKRDLSLGYRCKYIKKSGVFYGQGYDFVQTTIRGNHLATVDQGRMGPDVAVLDGSVLTITIDSKELKMTPEEMEKNLSELMGTVKTLMERVEEYEKASMGSDMEKKVSDMEEKSADMEEKSGDMEKKTTDMEEKVCDMEEKSKDMAKDMEDKSEAMDSLKSTIDSLQTAVDSLEKGGMKIFLGEISKRDVLASKISDHVGTFDHAEMTVQDVAAYGVDKLGITCDKGAEIATLNGYLHGRKPATTGHSMDSQESMKELDSYITGDSK